MSTHTPPGLEGGMCYRQQKHSLSVINQRITVSSTSWNELQPGSWCNLPCQLTQLHRGKILVLPARGKIPSGQLPESERRILKVRVNGDTSVWFPCFPQHPQGRAGSTVTARCNDNSRTQSWDSNRHKARQSQSRTQMTRLSYAPATPNQFEIDFG